MNCADVRDRLALLVYGDLPAPEAEMAEQHLAVCASCRAERSEIERLRRALDAAPAPIVNVDLKTLYQRLAERDAVRARRWRRAALAVFAVAAGLLITALALRLHVGLQNHQLLIRWGDAERPEKEVAPHRIERPATEHSAGDLASLRDEVHTLAELVQAVAADIDSRDRGRQQDVAALQSRIDSLQQRLTRLQSATEDDVAALYTAHFPPNPKGAMP